MTRNISDKALLQKKINLTRLSFQLPDRVLVDHSSPCHRAMPRSLSEHSGRDDQPSWALPRNSNENADNTIHNRTAVHLPSLSYYPAPWFPMCLSTLLLSLIRARYLWVQLWAHFQQEPNHSLYFPLPGCRALASSDSADTDCSHLQHTSFPASIRCSLWMYSASDGTCTIQCPKSSISIPSLSGIGLLSPICSSRPGAHPKEKNIYI